MIGVLCCKGPPCSRPILGLEDVLLHHDCVVDCAACRTPLKPIAHRLLQLSLTHTCLPPPRLDRSAQRCWSSSGSSCSRYRAAPQPLHRGPA